MFHKNRKTSSIIFSVSYEKDTTKDSKARQLTKPWPTKTILNQNEPKLLFETRQNPSEKKKEKGDKTENKHTKKTEK